MNPFSLSFWQEATPSGAHLNPAVRIGLASIGTFHWARAPGYIVAQTAGAFLCGVLVWLTWLPHWPLTRTNARSWPS